MDVNAVAEGLKSLLRAEGNLSFKYAEVAAQADTEDTLRQAADISGWFDSGRQFSTLKQYRETGRAWMRSDGTFAWVKDPALTGDKPWSVHYELASGPKVEHLTADERVELIARWCAERGKRMGKRDARTAAGKKPMKDDKDAPVEAVANILSDPETVTKLASDPEALAQMRRTMAKVEERADELREPTSKQTQELSDYLWAIGQLEKYEAGVARILERLMRVSPTSDERAALLRVMGELEDKLAWIRSHVESGERSFETELQDFLS